MAPESLQSNVYSQMSDVWGFGVSCSLTHKIIIIIIVVVIINVIIIITIVMQVTLWELFTLGQEPYGDSPTPGHIIQVILPLLAQYHDDHDDDDDDDDDDQPI